MATFPTLNRRNQDDRLPDNGLVMTSAPNGRMFGQSLYLEMYYNFRVLMPNLSQAEMDALIQFEEDNRALAFDYVYEVAGMPDITYECVFLNPGVKIIATQSVIMGEASFRGRIKP